MPDFGKHCASIIESRHVDVIEMDAASHTGIDDIRDIIERVRYAPVSARYKVYIIDEVHMLSTAASNTLLKTLEEPPAHVVSVLATTDPQKVLPTIRSRTQHFEFTLLSHEELVGHLSDILAREGVDTDKDREKWTFKNSREGAQTRAMLTGHYWETLHIDLRELPAVLIGALVSAAVHCLLS